MDVVTDPGVGAGVEGTPASVRVGRCAECRYWFRGVPTECGRCPECGWEYDEGTWVWHARNSVLAVVIVAMGVGTGVCIVWMGMSPTRPGVLSWSMGGIVCGVLLWLVLRNLAKRVRAIRSGLLVMATAEGLLVRTAEVNGTRMVPWSSIRRVRVVDRYYRYMVDLDVGPGSVVPIRGVFRDGADLQRFVEVVNARVREARRRLG